MRIIIAPDKFKGCLSASEVAEAIAEGLRRVDGQIEIDPCPMADGGEGTVDALVAATGGRIETRRVTGPLAGMRVEAPIGILGDGKTSVIEMSSASGLHLVPPEKQNPLRTTTYGTGELMRHAVDLGVETVIIGIGGSGTIDGGIGAVQGWGGKVMLGSGKAYSTGDRVITGGDIERISRVEIDGRVVVDAAFATKRPVKDKPAPRLEGPAGRARFVVATDVGNPLYGPHGAAQIFGPQKGATPEQVKQLDAALQRLAKRSHAAHLADAPGAGAAGGLGFGLMAFFAAEVRSGIEIVIEATKLRDRLAGADLCITGEGQLDQQTLTGKTCIGVARVCRELGVPCVALAGAVLEGVEPAFEEGLVSYFSICDRPMSLEEAMRDGRRLLADAAMNVVRLVKRGQPA